MSKPRYKWWGYIKNVIRAYPGLKREYDDLHEQSVTANMSGMPGGGSVSRGVENIAVRELPRTSQREYEAVRQAISVTEHMNASRDRLKIIDLVYWKKTHTLEGAALMIPCSYRTARRYHEAFIELVAQKYGLMDS